jgi:hypothetical protein
MLEFYPALHEYRDGETVVPSVTQLLKSAGFIDERFYTEEARDRGSAVHALCERYAQGCRTDGKGRRLEELAYVNAFAAWVKGKGVYAISTEAMIDHVIDGFRYCGRYDLLAEIGGRRVLVDIKTGSPTKWHPIQMAMYAVAVDPDRSMVLYLKADGGYKERYISPRELLSGIESLKVAASTLKLKSLRSFSDLTEKDREAAGKSWFGLRL